MKVNCDSEGIQKARNVIREGGIVIFPTDTVYGIGCDPFNKASVERIYQIKKRDKKKALPILTYSLEFALEIVEFDKLSKIIAQKFWPGPLTLILKLKDKKLKESLGIRNKIAIRVPDHQCLLSILKDTKFLVGTSANISGEKTYTKAQGWYTKFAGVDIFVDGGDIDNKGESTILEIENRTPIIHRQGPIKKEEIEEYL